MTTYTIAQAADAIQESMHRDRSVKVTAPGVTIEDAIATIRTAWLVDADGEPMPASRNCDIDYARLDDGTLDVWGWSHETAPSDQDWRLKVRLEGAPNA